LAVAVRVQQVAAEATEQILYFLPLHQLVAAVAVLTAAHSQVVVAVGLAAVQVN
jgi:hypothetical protein